jgi:hypothetical protein
MRYHSAAPIFQGNEHGAHKHGRQLARSERPSPQRQLYDTTAHSATTLCDG